MKRIEFKRFLRRISNEASGCRFHWLSVVQSDRNNRVYCEMKVMKGGKVLNTNAEGARVYGRIRGINFMSENEWVHTINVRRTVTGILFDVETRL